jgi:hypothetical protein
MGMHDARHEAQESASDVLAWFGRQRDTIIGCITRLEGLTVTLGPIAAGVRGEIEAAHGAVSESQLNLAVVGLEGHGKSTLINALAGMSVTPTADTQPGTVAPIFIEWGPDRFPAFLVTRYEADPSTSKAAKAPREVKTTIQCKNGREFSTYLLQEHNKGNTKRVVAGIVRCDLPMLRQGLRLVDVPGVKGVSPEISRDAFRFLKEHVPAAIMVLFGRSAYGESVGMLVELGFDPSWVKLIVNNVTSDHLRTYTRPQPGEAPLTLDERVPEVRTMVAHQLTEAARNRSAAWAGKSEAAFSAADVFVLSLLVMSERNDGDSRTRLSNPQHDAWHDGEVARFEARLGDVMREHGVYEVINRAALQASVAKNSLRQRLVDREKLLDAVLTGGPERRQEILNDFARVSKIVLGTWDAEINKGTMRETARRYWDQQVAQAGLAAKVTGIMHIEATRQEIDKLAGTITETRATEILNKLTTQLTDVTASIEQANKAALEELQSKLKKGIVARMNEFYAMMPVLDADTTIESQISVESVAQWGEGHVRRGGLERFGQIATTGALGWIGGTIGGGAGTAILLPLIPTPIGAAIVGGALVGGLALGIWELWQRDRRGALMKDVNDRAATINALDFSRQHGTDDAPTLYDTFERRVEALAAEMQGFLEYRLDEIKQLIDGTVLSPTRLQEEIMQVRASLTATDEITDVVEGIIAQINEYTTVGPGAR